MGVFDSIVILGGGGMLAHALAKAAGARGLHSLSLDRAACDITRPPAIDRMFEQHRPTLILNCAAFTKVDLCEEMPDIADAVNGNALGPLSLSCRQHNVKLVHFSTDFVFDGSSTTPYRPTDAVRPLSVYGRSKLLGEQMIQQIDPPDWLIIRTAWLYGPGGPSFPQTMLSLARQGVPLRVVSDQSGCPTFTFDLADATFDLLEHDAKGIFHLANAGQTTWFEFAKAVLREFGLEESAVTPITATDWKATRPKSAVRPAYSVLDTSDYQSLTGKPLRPWQQGLRAYRTLPADAQPAQN